jgi:hypothetical protein
MADLKTKETDDSVEKFLSAISEEQKREDCFALIKLMKQITGSPAKMWGTAIIGFGNHHFVCDSGREGDWFVMGFSPRKQNLTLYLMGGLQQHASSLKKLGKHKTGKGCLYFKTLADIEIPVLKEIIAKTAKKLKA